jgi:hypothetical protein
MTHLSSRTDYRDWEETKAFYANQNNDTGNISIIREFIVHTNIWQVEAKRPYAIDKKHSLMRVMDKESDEADN